MMDPVTVAETLAGAGALVMSAEAGAEAVVLWARARLVRAATDLPPGTEISGAGRDGSRWTVRVPAEPR